MGTASADGRVPDSKPEERVKLATMRSRSISKAIDASRPNTRGRSLVRSFRSLGSVRAA